MTRTAGLASPGTGTVLFLGSGFSAAAGLPTMAQFAEGFRQVVESRGIPHENARWLRRLSTEEISAVASAVYFAEHVAGVDLNLALNIEWTLAQLDMTMTVWNDTWRMATFDPERELGFVPVGESGLTAGICYDQTRAALVKVYRDPEGDITDDHPVCQVVASFAPLRAIVTTNYDRVAETALETLGLEWHHFATTIEPPAEGVVGVAKLHGDSLWSDEGTTLWGLRPPEERTSPNDFVQHEVQSIVLPTWIREPLPPGLRQVWREAHRAIMECEHLVIIGFGLPAADQHIAHFLTSSLCGARGDDLVPDRITIINPDPEAIRRPLDAIPQRLRARAIVRSVRVQEYEP